MTTAAGSLRRDVVSAYVASGARICSWVVVSAMVYRLVSPEAFAMLALVRATVGLLNNTSLGLGPAIIHFSAIGRPEKTGPPPALYANAWAVALGCGAVGAGLSLFYAAHFARWHRVPEQLLGQMGPVVMLMGAGTVLRLMSDAPGAILQANGQIALDNRLAASAEGIWVALTAAALPHRGLPAVALTFALAGLFLLGARTAMAPGRFVWPQRRLLNGTILWQLLSFGSLVALAQVADYLYAPTDYILINRLLAPADVANYAPAVQIDAGLLVLVTGLASVLLPRAALAHAAGNRRALRRYYLAGSAASAAILLIAGAAILAASPLLFRLWFGNSMPATRAILPLVLVHTVAGGSSGIGRSILLGMGKVRPFTVAVLVAGAANVVLSYTFVRYGGLGLRGIILGTIIAVVGRCAVWMPWYVMRTLREPDQA